MPILPIDLTGSCLLLPLVQSDVSSDQDVRQLEEPLFEAADVELNASLLMRFLQQNCSRDGSTYLIQREHGLDGEGGGQGQEGGQEASDCLRVYDLSSMGSTSSKKWKWYLACFLPSLSFGLSFLFSLLGFLVPL